MQKNELSATHKQAVELHQKILVSARLAQQNLFDMCTSLKEMRDSKLYKELNYSNFEDYCENEVGMKRSNVYRYISIIEKINPENVPPVGRFGVKKLALLATLSGEQQKEVVEKVDTETITYKQLKAEIDKLKSQNNDLNTKLDTTNQETIEVSKQRGKLYEQNRQLENKIQELESRPIEVTVTESSDNERRLQETIKSLERENIKHYDELETQYREDEQAVRRMLEQEKQEALEDLRAEYEEKLAENGVQVSDAYLNYLAALKNAENALGILVKTCTRITENEAFKAQIEINQIISNFSKNIKLAF